MIISIFAFALSLFFTFALIHYQHLHKNITSDNDLSGPQKFHVQAVPRIGGVSIFLSISITIMVATILFELDRDYIFLQLIGCALPAFIVGLSEDLTKLVGVKTRLIVISISASLAGIFLNIWINQVQVTGIDYLLTNTWISMAFTVFAITGLTNSYNIVDGFNGLASMVAIISLCAIGFVAYQVSDLVLVLNCLILISAISGFFIWNYPRGLIFLGDGGAYLIGFLVATISILLIKRNPAVSPWFVLLVNIYPIFETIFTIWRRRIYQAKNPGLPDGIHFHSLVYRRTIRWAGTDKCKDNMTYLKNAKTSHLMWILTSMAALPAIVWWDRTSILQCLTLLFCVTYIWLYKSVVKFKTPGIFKWLR